MSHTASGDPPVITSFEKDWTLAWTNSFTNGTATVEYRVSLATNTWQAETSTLTTGVVSTVQLPARTNDVTFYRVVGADMSDPPAGMVPLPSGFFQMGDNYEEGDPNELPVHTVHVSGLFIDRFEVSNERMREVLQYALDAEKVGATENTVTNREGQPQQLLDLDDSDCQISYTGGVFVVDTNLDEFPCIEVSWYGAQAYCNYRSDTSGLDRCINFTNWTCDFGKNGYRLPTEAEWEKAARGGLTAHHFPWDSDGGSYTGHIDGSSANYSGSGDPYEDPLGPPDTTPVGYYDGGQVPAGDDMANGYGLYDMAGNVWEWCWDWYNAAWYYEPAASRDNPTGPTNGTSRIRRGGGWNVSSDALRNANRSLKSPSTTHDYLGFRTVRRL